ncbi:MBL fold metallo-hydrolase [Glaciecola sp. MH2013]|uniref:MBL fold metallo-hydrolase n=1 Tax=Glaciecola sp. MH2013 TaxID=2785524 RepID=UPI00189DCE9E|nr:MBL fold metallo-hydrolase [Glaciecola sp. MH2013]MBF7072556.1 MBL fold metallo-hydrolase [Glaciecola sp. MH2013]
MSVEFIAVDIPKEGELVEVATGIFWLRMPLPFDLDHINLYLVDDGDGYALIDTGIGTKRVEELWELILAKLDKGISKVIVTHMHPDHIGMAGFLVDKFKVALYMSHSEYFVARAISAGSRGASDWQDDNYLVRCGMGSKYIADAQKNRRESKGVGQVIRPIPVAFERLQAGASINLGGELWRVIIGRGHSPEHVCLFNDERKILLSGDHVLPIISPNIGVYSTEPNANSLEMYLSTLPPFLDLPSETLVLPSHKQPFHGLHSRVEALLAHHHLHLSNLRAFCAQERSIKECLPILFKRELNQHNMFFAIAEAFSHLNYLYFCGDCSREIGKDGEYLFKTKEA